MGEWQTIENAPRDERWMLLWFPEGFWATGQQVAIGFWSTEDKDWFDNEAASRPMTDFGSQPTHWMPLPEPPK